jgi:hypothetical protein
MIERSEIEGIAQRWVNTLGTPLHLRVPMITQDIDNAHPELSSLEWERAVEMANEVRQELYDRAMQEAWSV